MRFELDYIKATEPLDGKLGESRHFFMQEK